MKVRFGGKLLAPPLIPASGLRRVIVGRLVLTSTSGVKGGADTILKEVALPGERVVEEAPRRTNAAAAIARQIPGEADAWRHIVLVGGVGAARHARVTGVGATLWRVRENLLRLLSRSKRVECVARLDKRHCRPRSARRRLIVRFERGRNSSCT